MKIFLFLGIAKLYHITITADHADKSLIRSNLTFVHVLGQVIHFNSIILEYVPKMKNFFNFLGQAYYLANTRYHANKYLTRKRLIFHVLAGTLTCLDATEGHAASTSF